MQATSGGPPIVVLRDPISSDDLRRLLEEGFGDMVRGANYYPDCSTKECIEYTSLINIRPAQSNPGMEIADPAIREDVRALTFELIGKGKVG